MDGDAIHVEQIFDGLLVRLLGGGRGGFGQGLFFPAGHASDGGGSDRQHQEGDLWHPGHEGHGRDDARGGRQRLAGLEKLFGDVLPDTMARRDLGDEEARTDRDDQRGDLTDQTVTDRENRVGLQGHADRHAVRVAHGDPADDVHGGDDQASLGIAADELAGPIHGPVEFAFLDDLAASLVGLSLRDGAGIQVGIDGHLFAGHGVEGESRRDFADALGPLGDNNELDDDENQKDDQADDETATGDETAKGLDDLAGVALQEDQTGGGDVEGEPKQGDEQQQRREGGEFEGFLGGEGHNQHGDT